MPRTHRSLAIDPAVLHNLEHTIVDLGAEQAKLADTFGSSLAGADIEALLFLVMMQAAKSAQEDLKAVMAQVKAINDAKRRQRELLGRMHTGSSGLASAAADAAAETWANELDSMSELGEMESLRLQMQMDRMSKMMSTLSNLLKKISDTANSITQNLK